MENDIFSKRYFSPYNLGSLSAITVYDAHARSPSCPKFPAMIYEIVRTMNKMILLQIWLKYSIVLQRMCWLMGTSNCNQSLMAKINHTIKLGSLKVSYLYKF